MSPNAAPVRRIILVDDHPIVRQGLKLLIEDERDLEVCGEAVTVRDARRAIRDKRPDAVVVDISLRDGDGIELVTELHAHHSSLSVLVLSMHDESGVLVDGFDSPPMVLSPYNPRYIPALLEGAGCIPRLDFASCRWTPGRRLSPAVQRMLDAAGTGAPPQPKKCGIKEMLEHFLDFRIITTTRRFQYQLAELKKRIHTLDGFTTIFDALDETIKIIRASDGKQDAAQKKEVEARIKAVEAQRQPEPLIRALWDRGEPSPTYLLQRGDYLSPTRLVGPGFPSVLTDGKAALIASPPWPGAKKTGSDWPWPAGSPNPNIR